MANRIFDRIYANRWIDLNGHTIKFVNQVAFVDDGDVGYFERNSDFVVLEKNPIKVESEPLKKSKHK